MDRKKIPLHDFSRDDETSIPFQVLPLEKKTAYDTSVPHRHNYYEIFLFEEGGGFHDVDFTAHEIASMSVHFVSPGQVHLIRRALDSMGMVIFFSRDFYSLNLQNKDILFELPFFNNMTSRPLLDLDPSDFMILKGVARRIIEEYERDTSYQEEVIRSYLNIFLLECRRLFEAMVPKEIWQAKPGQDQFWQFKVHLEKNFRELHQVQEYAALLAITDKYLNELCKRATGKTASELIQERIVLEAKRLLAHSDRNNKEVAYFLNFEDPSHFSKFFKKRVGMTPSEFRKVDFRKKQV